MSLDGADLYQDIVLQHGRHPQHAGRPAHYNASAQGENPLCGDRVEVFLSYTPDGRIRDPRFDARGCAISIASADLMAQTVAGLAPDEAREMFSRFRGMAQTGACADDGTMDLLRPLAGVHAYPSRVKCATLPWHALIAALDGRGQATSE